MIEAQSTNIFFSDYWFCVIRKQIRIKHKNLWKHSKTPQRIFQKIVCTDALWFVKPLLCAAHPFIPCSPISSPPLYCGSAHTWPSQIRALENQQAKRKAGCMVERREGIGGEGGVRPTGSFSIPMEQKVNDGPIVLWESWPEEKCYRESRPVPTSSNKRGPVISCIEFLPYSYHLHGCFMSHWTSAHSRSPCCNVNVFGAARRQRMKGFVFSNSNTMRHTVNSGESERVLSTSDLKYMKILKCLKLLFNHIQ